MELSSGKKQDGSRATQAKGRVMFEHKMSGQTENSLEFRARQSYPFP